MQSAQNMRTTIFILAACLSSGKLALAERFEFEEPHMGTKVRLVFYAERSIAVNAARAAFQRIREIEDVLSDYRPGSEIMKLCISNDERPNTPITISDDLNTVLKTALEISKTSNGAFDVTVGPLSELWRETRKTKTIPSTQALAHAKSKVGWDKVTHNAQQKTVCLKVPGMRLDFGGIGKGYAADEALKVLKKLGIDTAMVSLSGDIAVSGPPPGKKSWNIEIEPLGSMQRPRVLQLTHSAVSTSGDLYQYVEIHGIRYSHVLDPKTGMGLTGWRSATVVAPSGIEADALSKVAAVLMPKDGLKIIERFKGQASISVKGECTYESEKFSTLLAN